MKNLLNTLIILTFIATFAISVTNENRNLEVVIKTSDKINQVAVKKIIEEFYRLENVIYAERISLTKSFMVIFDNDRVYAKDIEGIFSKWSQNNEIEMSYSLFN